MKGLFIGNPTLSQNARGNNGQVVDSILTEGMDESLIEIVSECKDDTIFVVQLSDSVPNRKFTKEKEQNMNMKSIGSSLPQLFDRSRFKNTSQINIIPAHFGTKKLHPYAKLGLALLVMSIVMFLVATQFLWPISNILVISSIILFVLSFFAFNAARQKMKSHMDEWSGKTLIDILFYIELVLLVSVVIFFILLLILIVLFSLI
jgi:hypothetical protein